jgi:hypothetical protein
MSGEQPRRHSTWFSKRPERSDGAGPARVLPPKALSMAQLHFLNEAILHCNAAKSSPGPRGEKFSTNPVERSNSLIRCSAMSCPSPKRRKW